MKTTKTASTGGNHPNAGTLVPVQTAAEHALARRALEGEALDVTTPTVQGAGVDTIEFSFDVEVSQELWDKLEEERLIAQLLMQERRAVHCPDWLNAQISPTGARGGYRFLLETPSFAVKLLRGIPNRPPIYVEMRAFGLHTYVGGERAACEAACAYIREVLLADQDPEWAEKAISLETARCSRLDLYLDWQGGWHPDFTAGDEQHFIKRVHAEVERYSCDGKVTGYAIGRGEVRARIYDKTTQMKKAHQEWYPTLLSERNAARYDPELTVWRLEFQMRREGVKGFKLYARPEADDPDDVIDAELEAEDLPHIHSVAKALHWAGHLWSYLSKRWLRLAVPTTDPNRGRWPEHPTWTALRDSFAPIALRGAPLLPQQVELVRAKRYTGYRRLLDRMAVGVVTTLEAMDTDPGAAAVAYMKYMHRLAGRIRRAQKLRKQAWRKEETERQRTGRPLRTTPDLSRGMGAKLDTNARIKRVEQLLDMALGVFTSAGVVQLQLRQEADVAQVRDLLEYSLDELEEIAAEKGGIRVLLDEKWQKVYKASAPRGMFSTSQAHCR